MRAKPSMKYWVRSGLRATPNWLKKPRPPLSNRTATSGQARAAALPSALSASASLVNFVGLLENRLLLLLREVLEDAHAADEPLAGWVEELAV